MPRLGRILCVTSNFPRWHGDSTTPFVLHLAEDLAALGWQVDVLAPHAPEAKPFETFGNVNVYRFRYLWPESQQTVCYQGGALVNLRKNPLNKLKLPMLVAAQFIAMFWRLLVGKYDSIHAHWLVPQGFNSILLGGLFRIPVVVTVHGGDIFGLRGRIIDAFKRCVLIGADAITTNSRFTEDAVRELCKTVPKIYKIPMGVSIGKLTLESKNKADKIRSKYRKGKGPLLVFVGRLVEEKGVADLLRAVALLVSDLADVSVLIAGDGPDRSEFECLADSLGVSDCCHFVGWVDPVDVRAYMSAADFFVGPSRTASDGWVEAQGLTFLEAMSVGTVPIGSRLGGIKESIIEGETGFLVDEGCPEQIAQVISQYAYDNSKLGCIANQAREFVEDNFSRTISASRFSAIFEGLSKNLV